MESIEKSKESNFPLKEIFLTGIESSDPFVQGKRRNQLYEAYDFYSNYKIRLENISKLGIKYLRFGNPYSKAHLGKDTYDFSFSDKVVEKCSELGIEIIADLLHFGLAEWMHSDNKDNPFFQNKDFPVYFSEYAREFVKRYPSIKYFTIINEPFVTAYFSTKLGIWNESIKTGWEDDRAFVNAVKNIAKAAILARKEIEKVCIEEKRSDGPVFVQNESFELAISSQKERQKEVERFNLRRFAALDLIFGKYDERMKEYLLSEGMTLQEYDWFMINASKESTILGIDYYFSCVHELTEGGIINHDSKNPFRLYEIAKEYADRYNLPLLHTETNACNDDAINICRKTYQDLVRLKKEGYEILGMAWYGDEYQVGWQYALYGEKSLSEIHPVGLYFKGELQPVGALFCEMAKKGLVTSS